MSVNWTHDNWGADGDFAHGRLAVNLWQDREIFEAQMDERLAVIREGMLAAWQRNQDAP